MLQRENDGCASIGKGKTVTLTAEPVKGMLRSQESAPRVTERLTRKRTTSPGSAASANLMTALQDG